MCLPAPNVKNATPPCRRTTAEKLERAGCQASAAIYGRGHRVSSTRATPARLFARRNPAAAILSWLIAFGVVNTRNQAVAMIAEFLYRITEPALRPIRAVLPHLGGIDISPVILILIIYFIQEVIIRYIYPYVF